jgi:two-component system cell cycle response regulator DivK
VATIVVVEDEPMIRQLVAAVLTAQGHRVTALPDGSALAAAVAAARPDLVLLDLQLPGADGFALLAALRNAKGDPPLRVVALSASSAAADRERIRAAGFDGYIAKPIDLKTFSRDVRAYLG